jgi:hypothetical protein
MRGLATVVCLVAVLGSAACSDSGGEPAATGGPPASPGLPNSATATASPTPSGPPPLAQPDRQRKARAGLIAPNGLAPMGGPSKPKTDDDTTDAYHRYCGLVPPISGGRAHSYRYWAGQGLLVEQQVEGLGTGTGAQIVQAVKGNVADCTRTYQVSTRTFQIVGPVDLGAVGGTEAAFGVCVKFTEGGDTTFWCHAYLARGSFVTYLAVISGPTLASSTKALKQVVLLAAGPLGATDTA